MMRSSSKNKLTYNQSVKRNVRSTKAWREFREQMKILAKGRDEITGRRLRKGWELHHMDLNIENYGDFDKDKFICVNKETHQLLHFILRQPDKDLLINRIKDNIIRTVKINGGY